MFGYRGEERARVESERALVAVDEALVRLPFVRARRAARVWSGALTLAISVVLYALVVPRFEALDQLFAAPGCAQPLALAEECAPNWRPRAVFSVIGFGAALWALLRVLAYPWAKRRIARSLQKARARGELLERLREELAATEHEEWVSAAVPMACVVLLGPFAVHSFVVPGLGMDVFDSWISALGAGAFFAQLALVAFTVSDAKRWRKLPMHALENDRSWVSAYWVVVPIAMATIVVYLVGTRAVDFVFYVWAMLGVALVASVTFALTWPIAHRVVRLWIVRERDELHSIRALLEHVGDAVRVEDIAELEAPPSYAEPVLALRAAC